MVVCVLSTILMLYIVTDVNKLIYFLYKYGLRQEQSLQGALQ